MKRSVTVKEGMLLIRLATIMVFIFAGVASAQSIPLAESPPAVMYYTTNGADPIVTPPTETTIYTNYYVVEGAKITPPNTAAFADTPLGSSETISLVPNAGKGTQYVRPGKLKIHESKKEFEENVKQKYGKRFKVERFNIKQTKYGLEGSIRIIENRDPGILQLGDRCTVAERAKRIAIIREFMVNNPELIGLTENEELHERGLEQQYCEDLYFVRLINGYEISGSVFHFVFVPQFNFSASIDLDPITLEMYTAAQQEALTPEEIAKIVYKDLNISLDSKNGKKPPKLYMRKYLQSSEPYVIWKVGGPYAYEINALSGEIIQKTSPVLY